MKTLLTTLALTLTLISVSTSDALACEALPWLNDPSVPLCPKEGSSLILPDTYPAAAVVTPLLDETSDEMPLAILGDILNHSPDRLPLMVIPGFLDSRDGTPEQIKEAFIHELLEKVKNTHARPSLKEKLKKLVLLPPGQSHMWTQDILNTTFNPETGMPILHPIRDYLYIQKEESPLTVHEITNAIHQACPSITHGSSIPPTGVMTFPLGQHADLDSESGGNSLGLPGGLYLTGTHQPREKIGAYYAKNEQDEVRLPVNWLAVGHVDEIVSIVKDATQAPPCNFAVVMPSPARALTLLGDPRFANEPFFKNLPDYLETEQIPTLGEKAICNLLVRYQALQKKSHATSAASCAVTQPTCAPSLPQLQPFEGLIYKRERRLKSLGLTCNPSRVTNGQVVQALASEAGEELYRYNEGIQKILKQAKEILIQKLTERTGCQKIKVLPLPNLYTGGKAIRKAPKANDSELTFRERFALPFETLYTGDLTPHGSHAIFPNSTNLLTVQNLIIAPKPHQSIFEMDIRETFSKLGTPFSLQDDWECHTNEGDIHCMARTIRVCRPNGAEQKASAAH